MGNSQLERLRQARKAKRADGGSAGGESKDVTNRKIPMQSGLEKRRAQLLPEYHNRRRKGQMIDRRFGETDAQQTTEDRALRRFTRERQRKANRASLFDIDNIDVGQASEGLTHLGASLSYSGANSPPLGSVSADPARKRAEIYAEVISKSKAHKADRQQIRDADGDTRAQLDHEVGALQKLLRAPEDNSITNAEMANDEDKTYNRLLKELAFEPRAARASERLKSDVEKLADAQKLQEDAEAARLARNKGRSEDSGHERRRSEADDLDDDPEDEQGLAARRHFIETSSAYAKDAQAVYLADDRSAKSSAIFDDASGSLGPESAESERANGSPDLDHSQLRPARTGSEAAETHCACPQSHTELVELLKRSGRPAAALDEVVRRVRTLYHPNLGGDNKDKMEVFVGVLIDHAFAITSQLPPDVDVLDALVPHIFALCSLCPLAAAEHCIARLRLMHKNLLNGLERALRGFEARTWPLLPELTMLRLVGLLWSTSDESHPVGARAMLLLGQYLSQCRIRRLTDIAIGLYCCSLSLQYEGLSKRLCPEAMHFLGQTLSLLLPITSEDARTQWSTFAPTGDQVATFCVSRQSALSDGGIRIGSILAQGGSANNADLAVIALQLVRRFAEAHALAAAFIELFEPAAALVMSVQRSLLPPLLLDLHKDVRECLSRMLRMARQTRRPLILQEHRAVPLASHAPKFDDVGGKRFFDPDSERAEAAKLRSLHKKEKKGAVRELRKDARFLADHKLTSQRGREEEYRKKLGRISADLQSERNEQRRFDKGKKRKR